MNTTLFSLINACHSARIDGYEVDDFTWFQGDKEFRRISWCSGDEGATFKDQPLTLDAGRTDFEVKDVHGETYSIEFLGHPQHLTAESVAEFEASVLPQGDVPAEATDAEGPKCPNCGRAIAGHEEDGCVLASLIAVIRDRGNKTEDELTQLHAACNVDALWSSLGKIIDRLEDGGFND